MSTHMPPEVWYLIADHLHQIELPPLLLVSRLHRLVALKRLFGHLKICFAYPETDNTPYALLEVSRNETMSLSWEMLNRVKCDKAFASVVQRITIYYSTEELQQVDYFHNGVIVEALKALINLRSFAWVGNGLPLMDIVKKLPTCCPKLQEISMSIEDATALVYPSFHPTGLNSILYQDPTAHVEDFSFTHSTNDLAGGSESTVRSLSICAGPLWQVPVRIFENLSHLEIFLGRDMENITLVFRYAGRLESLSVLGLEDYAIFPLLEDHPNSLPSLRSFKILSTYKGWRLDLDIGEAQFISLAHFLCGKKELRALDIHMWTEGWSSLEPLWDMLKQLPSLEVLGITTGIGVFAREDFLSFAAALPPNLSALRVNSQWDIGEGGENDGCSTLIEALDRISFFYMRNYKYSFAFLSDELTRELPSVKILGLDQVMSYVFRDDDQAVEVRDWSVRRCFTRTVEDFDGNEDWEWLMRYHDLGEWAW